MTNEDNGEQPSSQGEVDISPQRTSRLDLNGDGRVDHKDLLHGMKVAGITVTAAASAVGVTAATAAIAGQALVGATASTIGTAAATTGGAIAGFATGLAAGTSTFGAVAVTKIGSALLIQSVTVTSVSASVVAKWTATTTAIAAATEIGSGFIAGLPIVKAVATAGLKTSGEIVVIAGTAFSVKAAIASGLIIAVAAGGTVYFLLTKEGAEKAE